MNSKSFRDQFSNRTTVPSLLGIPHKQIKGACSQFNNSLSPYFDGQLHGTDLSALKAHLLHCTFCQQKLKQFGSIRAAIQELSKSARPPQSILGTVKKMLHQQKVSSPKYPAKQ